VSDVVLASRMEDIGSRGFGVRVVCQFRGLRFETVELDVAVHEAVGGTVTRHIDGVLPWVDGFDVPTIRPEVTFAEKLHATTRRYGENRDRLSTRPRDLPDMVALIREGALDPERTGEVIAKTFRRRGTHDLPAELVLPPGFERAVRVAATVIRANRGGDTVAELASRKAYEVTGLGPDDVDVAELHDAAAGAELALYEQLGLGSGVELIRSMSTRLGGRIPVNVSGGLLSRGHPIGATGLGQVFELVTQLRGEAGVRQVAGARTALAENGGGYLDGDNAVAVVSILQGD